MMGCHFQDRPCRASLCLRGIHSGEGRRSLSMCDEGIEASCPHRGWDHRMRQEVCARRDDSIGHCPGCGRRHGSMVEALRCELSCTIQRCFAEEEGSPVRLDEVLPESMRAWAWRAIRDGVVLRDGGKCRRCGKDLSRVPSWMTEVHHVRPRNEGGSDHPSNLITLCTMCHKRVTADALLAQALHRSPWEDCLPRESLDSFR